MQHSLWPHMYCLAGTQSPSKTLYMQYQHHSHMPRVLWSNKWGSWKADAYENVFSFLFQLLMAHIRTHLSPFSPQSRHHIPQGVSGHQPFSSLTQLQWHRTLYCQRDPSNSLKHCLQASYIAVTQPKQSTLHQDLPLCYFTFSRVQLFPQLWADTTVPEKYCQDWSKISTQM